MRTMVFLIWLLTLFMVIFAYLNFHYRYWQYRGIAQCKIRSVFETLFQVKTVHTNEIAQKNYKEFKGKEKVVGDYLFFRPVIYALDLDVIKHVLIKDFNNFVDRFTDEENDINDPLSNHLFRMTADSWRIMRSKLSPTFTSGKMKLMFPIILQVTKEFEKAVEKTILASGDGDINIYDLTSRFTTDVIGNCIFGTECNSLQDPANQFRRIGRDIFQTQPFSVRLRSFALVYANLVKFIGFKPFPKHILDFIVDVVTETVKSREEQSIKRNDFMNLLIDLRNKKDEKGNFGLSIEDVVSQAFVFFAAGFETSSSNMSFCLLELARNPDVQEKLRAEIKEILNNYDGEITYEAMNEMKYLDQTVTETLRKWPALFTLKRLSAVDYKVPGTNIFIPKGTEVHIPVHEIHFDPDIYEDPEEFRPERFAPEEVKKRHPQSFLAFGDGPRNCIGLRFGGMQSRIGLISLLNKYRFSVCSKTKFVYEPPASTIVNVPGEGVFLKVEKL